MYLLAKTFLFSLDAELAHNLTLKLSKFIVRSPLSFFVKQKRVNKPFKLLGLEFPNKVGLAAGMDKNAECLEVWDALGFGFIEVGTVTPKAQVGNPKPRLFRLKNKNAIINRMGFNNHGVDNLISNLEKSKFSGILGINIGKNKTTPEEKAADDYIFCLRKVYKYADFITINISSPNTPDLRKLQFGEALDNLLSELNNEKDNLVKIAPDLTQDEVISLTKSFIKYNINGVIATNTTNSREKVVGEENANETGGLSGKPLEDASNIVIKTLRENLPENFPIIGVGGIMDSESGKAKLEAGANLVQIYTGLIYKGPELVGHLANKLQN
ncbi:UNVERIFIED_CONTAM: hypothetical protein GTU68_002170 [Idotea baltica]|nr:hypothetical protein [Idotea baltica]